MTPNSMLRALIKPLISCAFLTLLASPVSAQEVPVLDSPSSLSGAPTSARFAAGSKLSNSNFETFFESSEQVELIARVTPQSNHVGGGGTIYLLAIVGGKSYTLGADGNWTDFDGTISGLGKAKVIDSLSSTNDLSANNLTELTGRSGVAKVNGQVSFNVFVAYSSSINSNELYFSGVPHSFAVATGQALSATHLYSDGIEQQIVQARCINCHVGGGIAGSTGLVFSRTGDDTAAVNFQAFDSFAGANNEMLNYVLTKASGGLAHGGGPQLATGGADYNKLQNFLDVLVNGGSTTTVTTQASFFTGVSELSPRDTLRRAAIIFAGRAPSAAEYGAVESGSEAALRSSIRALMKGDNFHEFLLEGANDRLLVRGTNDNTFLDGGGVFPNYSNMDVELQLAARAQGRNWNFDLGRFNRGIDRGLKDSPLELIAYVVENEKPYSEVLTADYMMTNSIAAYAMNATGVFPDPENYGDFQPIKLDKYYAWSKELVRQQEVEVQRDRVLNPGSVFYAYPHAGILNTQAYLFRYPTTATNRNRARSRWTFLHFLDTDIEASAPRTTDPVALADNNNPTLYNPSCTVCHTAMDPLAGAFQNYGEEGHFKVNGSDSLDNFYKYPNGGKTEYQPGDTWYRDMRVPGLFEAKAPSSDNSLQWAAQQIVQDPRFARATVKFWWPSVIGAELLTQPQVQSDANYDARLMAYDAQVTTIQSLAEGFVNGGMNLKDLLVEMTMTSWFRANGVDDGSLDTVESQAHALANLGSERLLTPEQLARKTTSLTGFTWHNGYAFENNEQQSGLKNQYQLYYGGIDSAGVTKRARDMTALMSTVATTHASEAACPIVLREFGLNDGTRALFNGIDSLVSPLTEGFDNFTLNTSKNQTFTTSTARVNLTTTPKNLYVSINNGFCDWNESTRQCDSNSRIEVQSLEITYPNGTVQNIKPNSTNSTLSPECAWYHGNGVGLCNASKVSFPFSPTVPGEYKLAAKVWPVLEGNEHPLTKTVSLSIGAESALDARLGSALGAAQIKQKIVELFSRLHGEDYQPDSGEVEQVYQLFVESWEDVRSLPNSGQYANINWGPNISCDSWKDYALGVGLPTDIMPYEEGYNSTHDYYFINQTQEMNQYWASVGTDPQFSKRAWITVVFYMLSDYNYLYE